MKVEYTTLGGKPTIRLKTCREEIELVHGSVVKSLEHLPKAAVSQETIHRLKNIRRCLNYALLPGGLPDQTPMTPKAPLSRRKRRSTAKGRRFVLGLREMWSLLDAPVNGDAAERITRLREMFVEAQRAGIAVAKEIV